MATLNGGLTASGPVRFSQVDGGAGQEVEFVSPVKFSGPVSIPAGAILPIADGAVTTAKLSDGAVTTAKLADGAVTASRMAVLEADAGRPALVARVVGSSKRNLVDPVAVALEVSASKFDVAGVYVSTNVSPGANLDGSRQIGVAACVGIRADCDANISIDDSSAVVGVDMSPIGYRGHIQAFGGTFVAPFGIGVSAKGGHMGVGGSSAEGVGVKGTSAKAIGVLGESEDWVGGYFRSTRGAALRLAPIATLPDAAKSNLGDFAVTSDGVLHFFNGTAWKVVVLQ